MLTVVVVVWVIVLAVIVIAVVVVQSFELFFNLKSWLARFSSLTTVFITGERFYWSNVLMTNTVQVLYQY